MRRSAFAAIALAGAMLACGGCQGNPAAPTGHSGMEATKAVGAPEERIATWRQHTEPVELTMTSQITHNKKPQASYLPPDWGEDEVSRRIMDLTGVKLILEKQDDEAELAVIMAAQDDTDLICVWANEDARTLEESGRCQALDVLASQYCPDFWDDTDPLERLNNTCADGHIYTLRGGYRPQAVYDDDSIPVNPPWSMSLKTTLLEKMNASMPASVEELEALLYQVRDEIEGIIPYRMVDAVSTPLAGWMGVRRDAYWDEAAQRVRTPLREENWKDYLKLMSKWYRDGILALPGEADKPNAAYYDSEDPAEAAFMRSLDQDEWLRKTSGLSFVTAVAQNDAYREPAYVIRTGAEEKEQPFPYQIVTEPLAYQGEVRLIAADHAAWAAESCLGQSVSRGAALFITQACQRPDRALYFMQFLKSREGAQLVHWGVEGVHYALDENGMIEYLEDYQIPADAAEDAGIRDWKIESGIRYWTFMDNGWVSGRLNASPVAYLTNYDIKQVRAQQIQAGLSYKEYAGKNKNPVLQLAMPAESSEAGKQYAEIEQYWDTTLEEIITQARDDADVESRWADMMEQLNVMGLDELEEEMTLRFADELKRYHDAGYFTDIQP